MGRGALTLYLDTAENAEVAGGAGFPFQRDTSDQAYARGARMREAEARTRGAQSEEARARALQLGRRHRRV